MSASDTEACIGGWLSNAVDGSLPGQVLRLLVPLQGCDRHPCLRLRPRVPEAPHRGPGLEMQGTRLLAAFLIEKNDQDERLPIIPLISDNQGNIPSLIDSKSRKMPSAAILIELMHLLHCKSCTVAPSHVKRDFNQWADELTHPDYRGCAPDRRLSVNRLLREAFTFFR